MLLLAVVVGLFLGLLLAAAATGAAKRGIRRQVAAQASERSKYLASEIARLAHQLGTEDKRGAWGREGDEEMLMTKVLEYSMIERDAVRGKAVVRKLQRIQLGSETGPVVQEAERVLENRAREEELVAAQ